MDRRWLTTFQGMDGDAYIGPQLLADGQPMAEALLGCLRGPQGQALKILGELLPSWSLVNGETRARIRGQA